MNFHFIARSTVAISRAMQEKAFRGERERDLPKHLQILVLNTIDKEYEEIAALQEIEDEGRQIQIARERQQQVRQLFYNQARTNRIKVKHFYLFSLDSNKMYDILNIYFIFLASRMGNSSCESLSFE